MLIECEHHGHTAGIQVSPDLEPLLASDTSWPEYREIKYNHGGDSYIRIVVSASFATTHGLGEGGNFDLPDVYPTWHKELLIVCEKCLDSSIGT